MTTGTVLITGGHRGLGRALVRQFASAGYRVIAAGRQAGEMPEGVEALALDVGDPISIEAAAAQLSGRAIDILIHNAAIRGATGGLDEVETEDFLSVMRINALGPLLLTRALLPQLKAGERKLVAMISSRAGSNSEGHVDNPDGDYAYRCSKAALNLAVTKLAHDLKPEGLAVMALHPGWVRTDMGGDDAPLGMDESAAGLKRVIEGSDLSDTARFRTHDGQDIGW